MFLLNWYREWLEIRMERSCQNCDYLKQQLEIERQFNKVLIDKLTNKPNESIPMTQPTAPVLPPKFIPWRARKQILEQEDARAAQVMRAKQQEISIAPADDPDVKALEQEMEIIEKERTDAGQVR